MFNVIRQFGSATGVAVFTTVIVAVGATSAEAGQVTPNLAAYHLAFLLAAGIAMAGAVVALSIHDADAAAAVVRRPGRKAAPGGPIAAAPAAGAATEPGR